MVTNVGSDCLQLSPFYKHIGAIHTGELTADANQTFPVAAPSD